VMEALASALPVVAFDTAAASEHVVDGVSGRLVAPGDEGAFIAAVAALVAPGVALEPMGAAALTAARRATWPDVLARFEARLVETVHAQQAPPARIAIVA